jgi:hypothetical protein
MVGKERKGRRAIDDRWPSHKRKAQLYSHIMISNIIWLYALAISVPLFQVGNPEYFTHVSITTPVVSALKNYYI